MKPRRVKRPLLLVLLLLLLVGLLTLWIQRRPIASHYLERELARRGVDATYDVEHIGFGSERIANLVIGDPARPDLTARSVEVRLGWTLRGPKVGLIIARGVRLRGRWADGQLKLGQVDRLMPKAKGGPFRLPDQLVDLADAGMRLETPAGILGIGIEGRGRLSDGFRGRLALSSSAFRPGPCTLTSLKASWAVAVDRLRPHLVGPVVADRIACGAALAARRTELGLDARLEPGLDGWMGQARVAAADLAGSGSRAARLSGRIGFAGNASETKGRLSLHAEGAGAGGASASALSVEGPYSLAPATGRFVLAGAATGKGVRIPPAMIAPARDALAGLASTPLGPIARSWEAALQRAVRGGFDANASIQLAQEAGKGALRVRGLDAQASSGARLALAGGRGLAYFWPSGALGFDGTLRLAGGGLPEASLALAQVRPGGPLSGSARIAPVAAGGARLALGEIRFSPSGNGTAITTVATIDGAFGGGRVAGLVLPVRARIAPGGGFAVGESCTTVAFRALQTGTLRLGPTRLPLCPMGRALVWKRPGGRLSGGAAVARLRLAGTLGSSPIAIAAGPTRFTLADSTFAAADVAVRLGRAEAVNRLDIGALGGRFDRAGVSGTYSGLSGKLAAVPLLVSEGKGDWRMRGSDLDLHGALILSDAADPPRFYPLASRDFRLALANGRIEAAGSLADPKTLTHVVDARITHDLATGAGRALLDVPGIKFDPAYQPEQLTRLTVGVVALVDGVLKGHGEIGWDARGTTSSGTFSTENMNLAASFGPVEGLTTSLHFTDLLGLVSAPGQIATTKAIRTGIDVFDGRVAYQILPGLRVGVEDALWPFAGGELRLEPTILDFSQPAPKHLNFRVTGMDGARFVQQMQFSNISATGTFDGVVPMTFDQRGGRIDGGHLVAREGGGTLSYVGELTDKDLGTYGKLAFDALKSLRYSRLIVDLNGSLEGEFVAGIQLHGIARNVAAAPAPKGGISAMVVGRALGQLAKIPLRFNITVRGPFRAVIGTARSLSDPTNLIQSVLPEMLRDKPTTTTTTQPVQPQESEPVR